jgi:tetratricopeptide (TPR) repeat protein
VSQLRKLDAQLGDQRDAVKALAGSVLAFSLYQCGMHEEALAVASRSAAIAEECGDRDQLVGALGAQASALQELGRPFEAIALLSRAVPLAQQEGPRRVATVLCNLAVFLASIGRYAEAADRARAAIAAAQRGAERLTEGLARLVLGRALCSLGEWDAAVAEIESVKPRVPPYYIGMAIAPLVVIALARGQQDRVRVLVAEHASRFGTDSSDCDFRVLGSAALVIDRGGSVRELAQLIEDSEAADYAEWTGWLPRILDRIVAGPTDEPLATALTVLTGAGATKQASPVRAQVRRLEAHLASRDGDHALAAQGFSEAERLASECGMAFEKAVIELERVEHMVKTTRSAETPNIADGRTVFARLQARPWLARTDLIQPSCRRAEVFPS